MIAGVPPEAFGPGAVLPAPDDTRRVGHAFGASLGPGSVVGLSGPLGAGKTLFVQGACVALGVDERAVTSPTYTLVHAYRGQLPVVHADLYRLGGSHPEELGLEEELWSGRGVIFLEWPEAWDVDLPPSTWMVSLEPTPDGARRLRIRRRGDR